MLHHSHYLDKNSIAYLADALANHFSKKPDFTEIVVICIGTNRYPGDSLGPMVGNLLAPKLATLPRVHLYGTLEKPVHALNMHQILSHVAKTHNRAYVIAIDACLGQYYKIGTLQFVEEPLQPGVSLNKKLPDIGSVHIKGIVNNYGPLNHKVLEHTCLTFVGEMADVISRILLRAFQVMVPQLAPANPAPVEAVTKPVWRLWSQPKAR